MEDQPFTEEQYAQDDILRFFKYGHLPPHLQAHSKPWADLARHVVESVPRSPERTVALRKLLEGKRDIPVKLWIAPPTKMDAAELTKEGHYGVFGTAGARTEMPGCSLCMGNQAQVREGATVVSTSTRNFPNRLGKNTNVYLASAELAAIASKLGRIPTVAEYHADMGVINADGSKIYKYMNFDQIEEYAEAAKSVTA